MLLELNKSTRKKLLKLLKEMVTVTKLDLIALATKQGVTIAFFSDKDVNSAIFSAIASGLSISGAAVTSRMKHGTFQGAIVRGSLGYTILYSVEDFILIGASSDFACLGLAERVIRKYIKMIPQVFSEDRILELDEMISDLKVLL